MIVLKEKKIDGDKKKFLQVVQPFLEELTNQGYDWKLKGDDVHIRSSEGEDVACVSKNDKQKGAAWSGFKGEFHRRYFNYDVKESLIKYRCRFSKNMTIAIFFRKTVAV